MTGATTTACPRCSFAVSEDAFECPACGVVFARFESRAAEDRESPPPTDGVDDGFGSGGGNWPPAESMLPPGGAASWMSPPHALRFFAKFNIAGGVISLLASGLLLYLAKHEPVSGTTVGAAVWNIFIGVLGIWLGVASLRLYPPARYMLLFAAYSSLLAIPIGTTMAIPLLILFHKPGMRVLFSGKHPDDLAVAEVEQLYDLHESSAGTWFIRVVKAWLWLAVIALLLGLALGGAGIIRGSLREMKAVHELKRIDFVVRQTSLGGQSFPFARSVSDFARRFDGPVPLGDPWGNSYRYESQGTTFRVASPGPDGKWTYSRLSAYRAGLNPGDDLVVERGELVGASGKGRR